MMLRSWFFIHCLLKLFCTFLLDVIDFSFAQSSDPAMDLLLRPCFVLNHFLLRRRFSFILTDNVDG